MEIKLYLNKSPYNKISKDLKLLKTVQDVSLVGEFADHQPTIQMIVPSVDFNYFNIQGRYYFLVEKKFIRNGIVEIIGRLDTLMTYKDYVLNLTGIQVEGSGGSQLVPDGKALIKIKPEIEMVKSDGFSENEQDGIYILLTSQKGYIQA